MKRSLTAVLLAMSAATVFASNSPYNNEAGEQDVHTSIADAGKTEAGVQDQNFPQLG